MSGQRTSTPPSSSSMTPRPSSSPINRYVCVRSKECHGPLRNRLPTNGKWVNLPCERRLTHRDNDSAARIDENSSGQYSGNDRILDQHRRFGVGSGTVRNRSRYAGSRQMLRVQGVWALSDAVNGHAGVECEPKHIAVSGEPSP